jgi:hypothetical protein
MMNRQELAIVRTVTYASLFDYPLTLEQLRLTMISLAMSRDEILATYDGSMRLRSLIEHRDGFFFPAGRADLVGERRRREARSREFLARHTRLLQCVCALPFTRMVALSGSIAHLNLEDGGDLDLFIVTRGRRVWLVTLAMILLTRLLGARRIVCANLVMSDTHLAIKEEEQDLFTANQVLHLKPLFGMDVLEGFVAANPFVATFYPNHAPRAAAGFAIHRGRALRWLKAAAEWLLVVPSPALEAFCRHAYGWHLKRRSVSWRSPEQVRLQPDYLKLHTHSHRQSVLDRFDRRVDEALRQGERAAIA